MPPIIASEGAAVAAPLTQNERGQLMHHEGLIDRNLRGFREAGDALAAIRDGRLYRETHATFEAYCRERWDLSRRYVNHVIEGAEAVASLGTKVPNSTPLPVNAAQALAVAQAPKEAQGEVWQEAVERNNGEPATARQVREVTAEVMARNGVNPDGSPNPFAGEADAAAEVMAKHRAEKAAGPAPTLQLGTKVVTSPAPIAINDGDEFYTPSRFIESARRVMGGIDLDPASCALANQVVKATEFYSIEDAGLARVWQTKRAWLNPPYSDTLNWVAALEGALVAGTVEQATLLVNNKTETAWFELLWDHAVLCFVRSRIAFLQPQPDGTLREAGCGRTGSVVAYFPPTEGREEAIAAFTAEFRQYGRIVRAHDSADAA